MEDLMSRTDLRAAVFIISESNTLWAFPANLVHESKDPVWLETLIRDFTHSYFLNPKTLLKDFNHFTVSTIIKYSMIINKN